MSDNIPPDLIERELEAQFRIPNEIWTDVFKLLSRRVLVQIVSPVCYRFKEISNKNVKNIHVIRNEHWFYRDLEQDDPEANQQLEHLAGNDCQLAGQFRFGFVHQSISEKSQAILRHCPDLFNGCRIKSKFNEENKDSTLFLECLGHLESAKLVQISVVQDDLDQVFDFWHHPTFLKCTRVRVQFFFWPCLPAATPMAAAASMAAFVNIFNWLHHRQQPNDGMDDCNCDGSADQQQVRCMIIKLTGREHIDWLLDRCSQELQQGQGSTDRHSFVLSFFNYYPDWTGFDQFRRAENTSTGEVLVLDRVMNRNGRHPTYRLRRCPAEEEANGPVFYAGMFKRKGGLHDAFNIDKDNTPKVIIG